MVGACGRVSRDGSGVPDSDIDTVGGVDVVNDVTDELFAIDVDDIDGESDVAGDGRPPAPLTDVDG